MIPQIILFVISEVPGNIVNVLLSKVPLFIFIFFRFKYPRSLQDQDAKIIYYIRLPLVAFCMVQCVKQKDVYPVYVNIIQDIHGRLLPLNYLSW